MKKHKNLRMSRGAWAVLMGLAVVATGFATGSGAVLATSEDEPEGTPWGPPRPLYTMNEPADHVVFNSITNNPVLGNELNFVRVAEAGAGVEFSDEVKIEPGKEYEVYIGYHNNAASSLNESGVGIATGVKLSSLFPGEVKAGERGEVSATITATNADPQAVWDGAYLTADSNVKLRYKPASAKIYNDGYATNGQVLPETLFSDTGTYLGVNTLDGLIPGCAEYSGHVIYTLIAEQVGATVSKMVSTDGVKFEESATVKPGDIVTYKVEFKNIGQIDLTNVTFHDKFPEGLDLVKGTTTLVNQTYPNGEKLEDIINANGMNLGMYGPGATAEITYKAKVKDDAKCDTDLVNRMFVDHDSGEISDDAALKLEGCAEVAAVTKIPETGPAQIALAAVVVIAIIGGGFYLYDSQRRLDKTAKRVGVRGGASRNTTARKASGKTSTARKNTAMKSATRNAMKNAGRGTSTRTSARTSNTARKLTAAQKTMKSRKK